MLTIRLKAICSFSLSADVNASRRACTQSQRTFVHHHVAGLEGKRILVVDDNATNRHILQSQLEHWQFVPTLAESGTQALALLSQRSDFDLVITDMQMPEMDGIQLARQIHQRFAKLPVILLSFLGLEWQQAHANLFSSVLTKPVKQQALYQQLLQAFKQQDKAVLAESGAERKLSEEFGRQYPLRILIAEDNLVNQKLAMRILTRLGYQPEVVGNGQQALQAVGQKEYELILMDGQMPEMDGLEVTCWIRQQLDVQPIIIAITANAMPGTGRRVCWRVWMTT